MNPGGSPSREGSKRIIVAQPSVDSICSATARPFSSSASHMCAGFGMAWVAQASGESPAITSI